MQEPTKIVIKRNTNIAESSIFAIEEVKDNINLINDDINEKIENISNNIISIINSKEEYITNIINEKINTLDLETQKRIDSIYGNLMIQIKGLENNLNLVKNDILELREKISRIETDVSQHKEENLRIYSNLSKDTINSINKLSVEKDYLKEALNNLNEKLIAKIDEKETSIKNQIKEDVNISVDLAVNNRLTEIKKSHNKTQSSLNIETQVRRREDAQIKAILKRLLGKLSNIEDYFISQHIDIEDNLISDLRKYIKANDDLLGRLHLDNMVRISMLKDKLLNKGV